MRFLSLGEILALHSRINGMSGGAPGVRNFEMIASAAAQPRLSAGGLDAYPDLMEKVAALGYSLIRNHGFVVATNGFRMPQWKLR